MDDQKEQYYRGCLAHIITIVNKLLSWELDQAQTMFRRMVLIGAIAQDALRRGEIPAKNPDNPVT